MRDAADIARLFAAPIAHRGLHACGAPGPVENSVSAAEAAIQGGYGIECDVRLSRDGEAIVFHDAGLMRLAGVDGRVEDHDAADLATMRLGASRDGIPTLEAFLTAIAGRTPLVIEIKSAHDGDMRLTERTAAIVARHRGLVALESFDPAVIAHCRRLGVTCPVGLVGPPERDAAPDPGALAASDFASWHVDRLDAIVALCPHLPRSTWTVRTPIERARADLHQAQIVFEGWQPPFDRASGNAAR